MPGKPGAGYGALRQWRRGIGVGLDDPFAVAPCYIPPMRSIIKPILLGLLISTVLMAAIYGAAIMGSTPAINLLLKMTIPPLNIAASFLEPVSPDDLERGGKRIDLLLMLAWLQIGVVCALALAWLRAVLTRKK